MVIAVAVGGAAGSVARYLITALGPQTGFPGGDFPWWTLGVNVTGSFLLGLLARMLVTSSIEPTVFLALTVGVCGGYTTFSTFSYELLTLVERGEWMRAVVYGGASLVIGFAAVLAGAALGRGLRAGA